MFLSYKGFYVKKGNFLLYTLFYKIFFLLQILMTYYGTFTAKFPDIQTVTYP